jgi:hypothetical protein
MRPVRIQAPGVGNERGTALLLALMLVVLVGALVAGVSLTSRTEALIASSYRQGLEGLFVAEGAVERAVADLASIADWNTVLTGAVTSSFTDGAPFGTRTLPGGGSIVLCCGAGSLTADVQARAHGGASWDADTPQHQIFAWGPVSGWLAAGRITSPFYVVVWVADDPGDGDGIAAADKNGIVEIHAHAIGPLGARRVVHASVQRQTIGEDPVPGPGVRVLSWRELRW